MTTTDKVLSDFIADWKAGRRPRVHEVLQRVPAGPERERLAEQLSLWLRAAETPDYSEEQRAAIRASPAVQAAFAAADQEGGAWPVVLPRLRARAGLSVSALAARLVERLGLGSGQQERAVDYRERLEQGDPDADGLSRRLLRGLADVLGTRPGALGGLRTTLGPAAGAGGVAFRSAGAEPGGWIEAEIASMSRAALTPMPAPERMDELDRLFCGGPDA
mgnify:CR=1 FL=1